VLCLADDSEMAMIQAYTKPTSYLIGTRFHFAGKHGEDHVEEHSRLWNTDPKTCVKKKQKQTTEAR
jgi:hypothetical protein